MANALTVAAYICDRYQKKYGEKIDEMKLHKLLYFAQREALIQTGNPLFEETFQAWRYGPVMNKLRKPYQEDKFPPVSEEEAKELKPILDPVFHDFADMESFSLSRLTHGEFSWRNARKGLSSLDNSRRPIDTEDIRRDAQRVQERQMQLKEHGLL